MNNVFFQSHKYGFQHGQLTVHRLADGDGGDPDSEIGAKGWVILSLKTPKTKIPIQIHVDSDGNLAVYCHGKLDIRQYQ